MKKIILLILICVYFVAPIMAQKMTREERREMRRKGKQLKKEFESKFKAPEHLQAYKQETKSLQQSLDSLLKLAMQQKQLEDERQREAEKLKAEADAQKEDLNQLRNTINEARKKGIPPRGTFYAIQIGSEGYKKLKESNQEINLSNNDARQQAGVYLLGMFKDKKEAEELKKQITKIGISESWMVTYQDGKETANERNMATQKVNGITTK